MQIDHDPNERRPLGKLWWTYVWLVIGLLCAGRLYMADISWLDMGLGFGLGLAFIVSMQELTGSRD